MTPIQKVTAHIYMCPTGCGCLWKDNRDDTMSLFGPNSRSCDVCESLSLNELVPLYSTPQPPAVPDGYVLVPVEPTVTTEMKIDCIGEFSWKEEAPYYDENGIVHDYVAQHVVPWDICKDIFKRMYSHLVKECQLAAAQQGGGSNER